MIKKNKIPTEIRAQEIENMADAMKQLRLKPGSSRPTPEEVASKYEEAGDIYGKAGNFIKAQDLYRQAKIYGYTFSPQDANRIEDKIRRLRSEKALSSGLGRVLESRFSAAAILCFVFALLMISLNFTGYSISNISYNNSNWMALCLFVCGLIFAFLYIRGKKKF